ncbi:MAG TPA: hypothetical protein VKV28_10130 [Candidatus Binataceae bacterium]|nr:hypothetical protein [Candidatus Binataceae bacterium]
MAVDFRYHAYGLCLASDTALPELGAGCDHAAPDVTLRLMAPARRLRAPRWVFRSQAPDGRSWLRCARIAQGYLLRFAGLADFFLAADGSRVACHASSFSRDDPALRHLALDQVMPLAWKLRGGEALHASAVAIDGRVCAFFGPTGAGKSTLAASFVAAGYPLVCDDCLALLPPRDGAPLEVQPAYPALRLWPDALTLMAEIPGEVTLVASYADKQRWSANRADNFAAGVLPLHRLYRLERSSSGEGVSTWQTPTTRAAFMELVDATFRLDLSDRTLFKREFAALEQVARRIPMRRLRVGDDLRARQAHAAILADQ